MQKILDLLKQPLRGSRTQKIGVWLAMIALVASVFVGVLLKNSGEATYSFTQEEVTRTSSTAGLALDVFLKLGVVVALIGVSALAARKWMGKGVAWRPAARKMSVEETLNLSPNRALHLVRIGGQVLLIGATDHNVQLLKEITPEMAAEPAGQSAAEFSEYFQVSLDQFEPVSKGQG